ncbi:ATP-dependent RNA helicase vasa [Arctopsyche grandis]|uniref:ATP-dependent RNA helicase vasa n=1 Tax=Arctopsyche grandis TaxID=121162 RepID=UPI00406D738B
MADYDPYTGKPVDSGRSLNAGRGYPAFSQVSSFSDINDGEDVGSGYGSRGGGGRGRGRGGRGSGGGRGRGGRTNGASDFGDASDGDNGYDGQRGGYAGGRGGGRERGGDGSEKPREIYVPPDTDDSELFEAGISTGTNFDNYYHIRVQVSGENAPEAIESFAKSGLRPLVLENVKKSNYLKPTPIQKIAIPAISAGRDLMGCAQTGSGKTAAFLLPIINKLLEDKCDAEVSDRCCKPQVVIISPTRELTMQIFTEARKFSLGSTVKTCIVYGGTAVQHQSNNLSRGCHILVATAGRLLDFVERRYISFECVKFVVLDEADRMLDMGFMDSVKKMMDHPTMTPKGDRQTIMFSATFPERIQHLASEFLDQYIFVTIGILGGACADVEQVIYNVEKFEKKNKLRELLQESGSDQTLIFVETKRSADFIAVYVAESLKYRATSIHGDRLQRERETALSEFKSGKCNILVATAVAARGLDIKDVAHVINFDLPKTIDEYVHRIGRTGRVGNRGRATSFYDPSFDSFLASDLIKILEQADQPIPDFMQNYGSGGGDFRQEFGGEDVRKLAVQTNNDNFNCEEVW